MRTDGRYTIHHVRLDDWEPGRTLTLIPFGDVHRDSPACAVEKWREFLQSTAGRRDAMFLGMGDYLDSISTSERIILGDSRLHESTVENMETAAAMRVRQFAEEIGYMRGNLVGLMGGNHFFQFRDGTTSDQKLAGVLGTNYLGACTSIRISFRRKNGKRQWSQYAHCDIFAHHGRGGGTTAGGRMSAVEKAAQTVAECDIALMGDNHFRGVLPLGQRLRLQYNISGGLDLRHSQAFVGRTGSFLKAYEPGRQSYVVDSCMAPSSLGWIEFFITPFRSRTGGTDETGIEIKSLV